MNALLLDIDIKRIIKTYVDFDHSWNCQPLATLVAFNIVVFRSSMYT